MKHPIDSSEKRRRDVKSLVHDYRKPGRISRFLRDFSRGRPTLPW